MNALLDFFSFKDPNVLYVTLGMIALGLCSGVVGVFAFLRKRSLVGDAVSHAVLPGICLAFILSGTKNIAVLLIGALITGWLSLIVIDLITGRSKIPADAAIGLVLSVFFGVGILLLTSIQKTGKAAQAGLDKFLFGNAASLVKNDVIVFSMLCVIILISVFLFYKEFKILSFDRDFAQVIGLPVRFIEIVLATLTVLAVTAGMQAVGVVLMAAMLISPAAAAYYWTNDLKKMLFLSSLFGIVAGMAGAFISYSVPQMPTGPWVIVSISLIAVASMAFAPQKGWYSRFQKRIKNQQKILRENILKIFYHLGEQKGNFQLHHSIHDLSLKRNIPEKDLQKGLVSLVQQDLLKKNSSGWKLTEKGKTEAQRIVRIHRLWELYLSKYLKIAPDHVHEDAEAIEHIITPELEALLLKELEHPKEDPHLMTIPYKK